MVSLNKRLLVDSNESSGQSFSEYLFLTGLFFFGFGQVLSTSVVEPMLHFGVASPSGVGLLGLALMILSTIFARGSGVDRPRALSLPVLLLIVGFQVLYVSGSRYLIECAIPAIAAYGIKMSRIAVVISSSYSLALLASLGISSYASNALELSSFGQLHPNFVGGYSLMVFMAWFYSNGWKKPFATTIFGLALGLFDWMVVDTRTASFAILLLTILSLVLRRTSTTVLLAKLSNAVLLVCALGSVLVAKSFDIAGDFSSRANRISSLRLEYWFTIAHEFQVKPFGQALPLVSTLQSEELGVPALVLDNSYLYAFYVYGLVASALIFLTLWRTVHRARDSGDSVFLLIMLVWFVCGVSEKWLVMGGYTFVFMGVSAALASSASNWTLPESSRRDLSNESPA